MKRFISLMLTFLLLVTILPISQVSFASSEGQKTFILPGNIQEIEGQAFAGDLAITSLIIPNGVKSIGSEAFSGCTGIAEVTIASRSISIAKDAFKDCNRDMVFYTHNDSDAMVWAIAHGYKWESLDDDSDHLARFSALIAHSGFDPNLLQSNTYASKCLIVRTPEGINTLPDISEFNPTDIFKSDDHLYYIQFASEGDTEDCFKYIINANSGIKVEPDRIGATADITAQGVTKAANWGTNDTMGFDTYAPFVAQHREGSLTIAIIDSGVNKSSWSGKFSDSAISFVGGDAYTDSARHGSKVASIIDDCLGSNRSAVTLLPIKVVNNNSMYRTSVIIEGIKHAYTHGAGIINMSLGWDEADGSSAELERQLSIASSKGIQIVAAAGNGSGRVMYPASCNGVIAVSALTYSTESGYSVRSRTGSAIDYTAPGMYLNTIAYGDVDGAGDVMGIASTSFAAPQITAALALIKLDSQHAGNPTEWLNSCCFDLGTEGLQSSAYGHGLPQLGKLATIKAMDIVLNNLDADDIPSRLWLGETKNDFMLNWKVIPENADDNIISVLSENSSVVSVRQYGNTSALITAKDTGNATITVTNGSIVKEFELFVEKPVTKITIIGQDNMIIGDEQDLAVEIYDENATNRNVIWSSSNDSILTVTQDGHLTALKEGTALITCEAADTYGTKAQIEITVIDIPPATDIALSACEKEITDNAITLEVGEILTLEPSISPARAYQECIYSVFPKGIVEISDNGVLKAKAPGKATIVVTATTGQNVYTGLNVTVVIEPISVNIEAERTILDIAGTTTLQATILPEDATNKKVTWSSRSTAVATVDAMTGVVKAVAPGVAEIVCTTSNGKSESIEITVRRPINVFFDANGGTCTETCRISFSGYEIGELPTPKQTYWAFAGWFTEKNGGTLVSAESIFTNETTVYAHWEGLPYTITFDPNNGECNITEKECKVGSKLGMLPTAMRENYSFAGWYTKPSGDDFGAEVTADYVQSNNSDITVYAKWINNPYTVIFDANGGTCTTASKTGTVDTAIGLLPEPEREYYSFDGWFTDRVNGNQITTNYIQSNTTNITVYAHWSAEPYVMTFITNGGTCEITRMNCYVDSEVGELPVPTRDYYDFNGWYTGNEDGILVVDTYQQPTTDAVTVCAHWTPHEYHIYFDPNGGNCDQQSLIGIVDKEIGALPVATRDYYHFTGWYFDDLPMATQIDEKYLNHSDSDIYMVAHWEENNYTLTYNANGGSCTETAKQCRVDNVIGTLEIPNRPYYTFKGWYTAETGGTEITSSYVQNDDEPLTIYAQWTPGCYTITFDSNGGNCTTLSRIGTVDAAIGDLPEPTRMYYSFVGWNTESGSKLTSTYAQKTTDDITVYAEWMPLTYCMKFDVNGAGAVLQGPSIIDYYVDTEVGNLPVPTRAYYDFDGWYTSATGGNRITNSYMHSTINTVTVYAHWIPNTYLLNLNPNGGKCSQTTKTCSVDVAIGTLPEPTRTGYSFTGWYTESKGGILVDETTVYNTNSTVTIYAQWIANLYTYEIQYESTNGTYFGSNYLTYTFDTTHTITPPDFVGYTTPASIDVKWDQTYQLIVFKYVPEDVEKFNTGTKKWCSDPVMRYNATVLHRNRTADSVEIQITWKTEIAAGGYDQMAQKFNGSCNGVTIPKTTVVAFNEWKSSSSKLRDKIVSSSWITIPLTTTSATTISVKMEYHQYNSNNTCMSGSPYNYSKVTTTWTVPIPAY